MLQDLAIFVKGGLPEISNWHNSASSDRTVSGKSPDCSSHFGAPENTNLSVSWGGDTENSP